ncbi:hypothetical protein FRB97_000439 [Tulasnella sp. 331]|nr:hypothetical protein FRB97_000439 [Tulasnella sp. 331]
MVKSRVLQVKCHHALCIPEVLDHIFDLSGPSSKAAAAGVCQLWSSRALDRLWVEMPSILPLLELISPVVVLRQERHFANDINGANWGRFEEYATRIRSLTYDDSVPFRGVGQTPISDDLFYDFLIHRRAGDILPNLRSLHWLAWSPGTLRQLVAFFPSPLTHLHVLCAQWNECSKVFRNLGQRLSTLESLEVGADGGEKQWSSSLARFISRQKRLVHAKLPAAFVTSQDVVSALGDLPLLQTCESCEYLYFRRPIIDPPALQWRSRHFPTLERLDIHIPLQSAMEIVEKERPETLKAVCFTVRSVFRPAELHRLATTFHTSFPAIEKLDLSLFPSEDLSQVRFAHVKPLLNCHRLVRLRLSYASPLIFDKEDLEGMGREWPNMKDIDLGRDPVIHKNTDIVGPGLSLEVLDTFAMHFLALERLGVFVVGCPGTPDIWTSQRFAKLKELDFGTSPILQLSDATTYLSRLCPARIHIHATRSPGHFQSVRNADSKLDVYTLAAGFWAELGKLVNKSEAGGNM